MLDTVHIEEASYEGNERVLAEWFCQLNINSLKKRKELGLDRILVWVGDQLTVSRLWGLKKLHCEDLNSFERLEFLKQIFGWFHAEIAFEHSIHSQYYGTQAGHGLVHAFDLLQWKGLHSPSVQGEFHHNLQEGLYHIAHVCLRDLWCTVAGVQSLASLRDFNPKQLLALATKIQADFASTHALNQMYHKTEKEKDAVLTQAIMWNWDILDYIVLDNVIKNGDVGCIRALLPHMLFRFVGGTNSKYAIEILELIQGLEKEWPHDLRYACHTWWL